MRIIRHWPFSKLLIVCAAWIVVSVALLLASLYMWVLWLQASSDFGSGGIGSVSIGIMPEFLIIVSVLPVVALIGIWVWQRVRKTPSPD